MEKRLKKIRRFMREHDISGMLITKPENRRYFSGFSGSAGMLLLSDNASKLLTDFRYVEQATAEAVQYDIVRYTVSAYEMLTELTKELDVTTIGFESDFITYDMYTKLSDNLPDLNLIPVQIDALRMMKDVNEVAAINDVEGLPPNVNVTLVSSVFVRALPTPDASAAIGLSDLA